MKRGVKKHSSPVGAIRIISGQWRGRKLPVLNAQGLRPTTDRTKETLFNWLMHDIQNSRCLDMFAGSGGLGLEALSRYAQSVTFIEQDRSAAKSILQNLATLKIDASKGQLVEGDAIQQVVNLRPPFDLVFIDPPFHQGLVPKAIEALDSGNVLAPAAKIYIECESESSTYAVPDDWLIIKDKSTKTLHYRLYQYGTADNA